GVSENVDDNIACWVDGVEYAVKNGADIINMSLGGLEEFTTDESYQSYQELKVAIKNAVNAGVTVVVASGNNGSSCVNECPANVYEAITVGAVDKNKMRADFSNWGSAMDFVAPGDDVTGVLPGGQYTKSLGTSFATPRITALCAMLKQAHPNYKQSDIEKVLYSNTVDLGDAGWDFYYGYGLPDFSNQTPGTEKNDYDNSKDLEYIDICTKRESFKEDLEQPAIDGYQCTISENDIDITSISYTYQASENATIPESLTYNNKTYKVRNVSFYNENNPITVTKNLTVPGTIYSLSDWAFLSLPGLENVSLNEGLKSIGANAFSSANMKEISIPKSVKEIGYNALGYYPNPDPDNYESIKVKDFVIRGYVNSAAQSYAIKNAFTFIPIDGKKIGTVFMSGNCTYKVTKSSEVELAKVINAKKSQTIPATVNYNNKSYKVTSIAANAFKSKKKLKNITIGKNVKKIGDKAFYNCKNLKKITIKSTKIKKKNVGKNVFTKINSNAKFIYPKSKKKAYTKIFG
nr:S8 family serine peptidase [Lachnospiraceae bacterium]